jgi:type IV pilus assembly protein PilA
MKLRKLQKKMNQKGFTLIELIIVIAILGILAALAIPRFFGFTESAKQAADEEIANVIAQAGILYYAKNDAEPTLALLDSDDFVEKTYAIADLSSDKYTTTAGSAITILFFAQATPDTAIGCDASTDTLEVIIGDPAGGADDSYSVCK